MLNIGIFEINSGFHEQKLYILGENLQGLILQTIRTKKLFEYVYCNQMV